MIGRALSLVIARGEGDVLLTHSPAAEKAWLAEAVRVIRRPLADQLALLLPGASARRTRLLRQV